MKQKDVAKELRVTKEHLNSVLKKRTKPSVKLAIEIERIMGIRVEELIPEIQELFKLRGVLKNESKN